MLIRLSETLQLIDQLLTFLGDQSYNCEVIANNEIKLQIGPANYSLRGIEQC